MSDMETLRKVQMFASMDETELSALRKMMGDGHYVGGQTIIRQGESGDFFHIIAEGRVQFITTNAEGAEVILGEAGPETFFGELSMLTGEPRTARVRAAEPTRTLMLSRPQLNEFFIQHPQAAIDVLTEMARRLHKTDELVRTSVSKNVNDVEEAQMTVGQRVADAFAGLMGSWTFIIVQSCILAFWVVLNVMQATHIIHWDEYPFVFLNLALSFQAAYAAPIIMMSQNRSQEKDRLAAEIDHQVNIRAEVKTGQIITRLEDLERGMHALHEEQCALLRQGSKA